MAVQKPRGIGLGLLAIGDANHDLVITHEGNTTLGRFKCRRIDGLDVNGAQKLIESYNKRFPRVQKFLQQCVMEAQGQGYVETILGRRRPIPDISSPVLAIRNGAERMAINSVVQGSAADLIKIAMVNVYRRMKSEKSPSKMLLQVHDELVFETPEKIVENPKSFTGQYLKPKLASLPPVAAAG